MTEPNALQNILADHAARYPLMQIQDLYKLLNQAALGSGHAINNRQAARQWLEEEIANLADGPQEPLVDPISPDGLVRIHLRPFLQSKISPEVLLDGFILTADQFVPAPHRLPVYGQLAISMAKTGQLSFNPVEIEYFWSDMAGKGFPASHHSREFVEAYHPAYRVVLWDLLRDKLPPV